MYNLDKDALLCDLAETYHIYDFKSLPLTKIAIFAKGLREDSRIRMKMSQSKFNVKESLLAGILDRLTLILYSKTKDAEKGKNYPKLLLDEAEKKEDLQGFISGEDFEKMREKIIKGGVN
ncbi:DUF5361 domain-containing protein [uncultured Peptoniphilus sp.]|uniref:DUF5361 domain-containing protein n=1 Tax=uncultured Peptoniphilus sp. TaxID=254354 RepID=UPI002804EF25|nr:DUF5361 domain-containing protein [uncultured Peptoniphilus sp.]